MASPCQCNCTSQNGSGWCFPYELSLKPDPKGIDDQVLDLRPSPTDVVTLEVIRSSGSAGVCDTLYGSVCIEAYYCISGEQVTAPEAIPKRTAHVGIILPQGECVDYSQVTNTGTTFDGRPYMPISGIPMTYFPDANQLCCRWSASICGLDVETYCCDPAYQGFMPGYALCYQAFLRITNDGGPVCENELIAGTDGQGTPRMISVTKCNSYSYDDCSREPRVDPIDPFAETNPTNPNIWKIALEAIDAQEKIPDQSGIYKGDSYIGLIKPSGITPSP